MTALTCALGPDSAGTVLSRLLRGARHHVDAAIYEVGPSYRWELVRAARRGVRVRLVVDAHVSDGNAATAREVAAAGGTCRVAGVGTDTAHGKLLIVDSTVAVGTGNLIWRDAPRDRHLRVPPASPPLVGTREWWVSAAASRSLHRAARRVFDAHWAIATAPPEGWSAAPEARAPGVGAPTPQVAPLRRRVASRRVLLVAGGAPVGSILQAMVSRTRRRCFVTVPYAHTAVPRVRGLLDLMDDARARGVECGLLLGGTPEPRDAVRLRARSFEVRRMDPTRATEGHAKGVVADAVTLVSSANWSSAGLGGNWEVALRVADRRVAGYYAAAWQRDWQTGLGIDV